MTLSKIQIVCQSDKQSKQQSIRKPLYSKVVQYFDTTVQYLDIKKHLPASQIRGAIVDLST